MHKVMKKSFAEGMLAFNCSPRPDRFRYRLEISGLADEVICEPMYSLFLSSLGAGAWLVLSRPRKE